MSPRAAEPQIQKSRTCGAHVGDRISPVVLKSIYAGSAHPHNRGKYTDEQNAQRTLDGNYSAVAGRLIQQSHEDRVAPGPDPALGSGSSHDKPMHRSTSR